MSKLQWAVIGMMTSGVMRPQARRVAGKRATTLYLPGQSGTSETMKTAIESTVLEPTILGELAVQTLYK